MASPRLLSTARRSRFLTQSEIPYSPIAEVRSASVGCVLGVCCCRGLDGFADSFNSRCRRLSGTTLWGQCPGMAVSGSTNAPGNAPGSATNNIILGHGVSFNGKFEHPHDTPPHLITPSPTFAHSSPGPKVRIGLAMTACQRFLCAARPPRRTPALAQLRGDMVATEVRLRQKACAEVRISN